MIEGGNPDAPPIADEIPIDEGNYKQKLINFKVEAVKSIPRIPIGEIKVPTATKPSPLTNAIYTKETGTDYLGRGYDVVIGGFADAEYFSELSVLDINKLLKDGQIGKMDIDNSKGSYFSGETVHKYAQSRATSVNVKANYMLFKAGVNNAFSSSQFSEGGHSYSSIVYRAPLYALYINPALEDFTEYFTDEFKKTIRDAFDHKLPYGKFLQLYGTHMVRSVIMGGRIEHNVSTDYKYNKSESQRRTDVHASFNALFASASISVSDGKTQMSESFQSNHEEKTIASPAYGFPTLDGARFDAWFNNMRKEPGLCDFRPDSLVDHETLILKAEDVFYKDQDDYYENREHFDRFVDSYAYDNDDICPFPNTNSVFCLTGLYLYETTQGSSETLTDTLAVDGEVWTKVGIIGASIDNGRVDNRRWILYARYGMSTKENPPITNIYLVNTTKGQRALETFNLNHKGDSGANLYVPGKLKEYTSNEVVVQSRERLIYGNAEHTGADFTQSYAHRIELVYVRNANPIAKPITKVRFRVIKDNGEGITVYYPNNFSGDFQTVTDGRNHYQDTAEGYGGNPNVYGENYLEYSCD